MLVVVVGGRRSGGWVWEGGMIFDGSFLNSRQNNRVGIIAVLDVDVMTTF